MTPHRDTRPPARRHRIAFALLAALLVASAVRGGAKALSARGNDLTIFLDAARALAAGRDPSEVTDYLYLPFFAALLAPLDWLPRAVAVGVWQLGSHACVIAGLRGAVRLADPAGRWPWLGWASLLLTLRLWDSNLSYGQANAFTFAAAIAALELHARRRDVAAGAVAALATAFKVLPGVVLVLLTLRGRIRAAACAVALFATLSFGLPALWLGPSGSVAAHRAWHEQVARPYHTGGEALIQARGYIAGQSLLASAYRTLAATPTTAADPSARAALATWPPERVHRLARVAIGAHLALMAWASIRLRRRGAPEDVALAGALALCTALLCAPLVHKAHMAWSALAFAVLLARTAAADPAQRWKRAAPLAAAALLIGATTSFLLGVERSRAFVAHSGIFLAVECLWWMLLVEHFRESKTAEHARPAAPPTS